MARLTSITYSAPTDWKCVDLNTVIFHHQFLYTLSILYVTVYCTPYCGVYSLVCKWHCGVLNLYLHCKVTILACKPVQSRRTVAESRNININTVTRPFSTFKFILTPNFHLDTLKGQFCKCVLVLIHDYIHQWQVKVAKTFSAAFSTTARVHLLCTRTNTISVW